MPQITRPLSIAAAGAALIGAGLVATSAANGQNPAKQAAPAAASAGPAAAWNPPGTPGSPIDGSVFHAQVLLDLAGFPTGVIDGKQGMVYKQALRGFQQARGLKVSGELDGATRAALMQDKRPSTRLLQLTATDVGGPFVFPFPEDAADQAKLDEIGRAHV